MIECRGNTDYGFICSAIDGVFVDSKTGSCIRLRVNIDQQDSQSFSGDESTYIDGCRCFTNTAFLIDESIYTTHFN